MRDRATHPLGNFPLPREEIRDRSQVVTCASIKHARSVSALAEQEVAMSLSELRSPRAVCVNRENRRAFVRLREMIARNRDLVRRLEKLEKLCDAQFEVVFDAMRQLIEWDV